MAWQLAFRAPLYSQNVGAGSSGSGGAGNQGAAGRFDMRLIAYRRPSTSGFLQIQGTNWTAAGSNEITGLSDGSNRMTAGVYINAPSTAQGPGHAYQGPVTGQSIGLQYTGFASSASDLGSVSGVTFSSGVTATSDEVVITNPSVPLSDGSMLVTVIFCATSTALTSASYLRTDDQSTPLSPTTGTSENMGATNQCRASNYFAGTNGGSQVILFDRVVNSTDTLPTASYFKPSSTISGYIAYTFIVAGTGGAVTGPAPTNFFLMF